MGFFMVIRIKAEGFVINGGWRVRASWTQETDHQPTISQPPQNHHILPNQTPQNLNILLVNFNFPIYHVSRNPPVPHHQK
jgi:hypothetical protein